MFSELEKKVIASVQCDIPITERPYYELSKKLNITEEHLMHILKDFINRGVMRRFGATIRHQKSGYDANAMIAWKVTDKKVKKIGNIMASFEEVSHCYQRGTVEYWPYNLYTMIHSTSKAGCYKIIEKISKKTGINDYSVLFSIKELKKTSMVYFEDN